MLEQERTPNCRLNYTFARGYHLILHTKHPFGQRLHEDCIQVVRNRASVCFTTRELIKYNGLCKFLADSRMH